MTGSNILVDIYLAKNLGDDLFLDILLKRFPDTQFTILKCTEDYDAFLSGYKNVKRLPYNLFHKILNKLKIYDGYISRKLAKHNDAFIYLGGSIFMENANHLNQYRKRKTYLEAFNKKKKPVFVLGSNFGPYKTEKFLADYIDFFDKCFDLCFRDNYSYNLLKNNHKIRCNPDIVFGIMPPDTKKQKAIGFSIIDLSMREDLKKYEENYLVNISTLIKKAIREQYKVVLFSFCEHEGDMKTISKTLKVLPDEITKQIEIHNYIGDLKNTLNRLAEMELMIATRFHANILSQLFNQGVLPIIYSEKTINALSDIGLNEISINIKDNVIIDADLIWDKIKDNKIDISEISKMSDRHFEVLDKYINSLNKDNDIDKL